MPYFQVIKHNTVVGGLTSASRSSTFFPPVGACPGVKPRTSRTVSKNLFSIYLKRLKRVFYLHLIKMICMFRFARKI